MLYYSAGSCTFRFCAGSQHTSSNRLPAGRAASGFAACQQRLSTAAAAASSAPGSSVHKHRALPAIFRIQAQRARLAVQNGGDILLQLRVALGGGGVLAVPLFKKHRELPTQLNEQILCASRTLHHQRQILLFHVVKVRVVPCVHGDLLSAEQHQQLPLLFSGVKIALRAVPICVHRCSSVFLLYGRGFPAV